MQSLSVRANYVVTTNDSNAWRKYFSFISQVEGSKTSLLVNASLWKGLCFPLRTVRSRFDPCCNLRRFQPSIELPSNSHSHSNSYSNLVRPQSTTKYMAIGDANANSYTNAIPDVASHTNSNSSAHTHSNASANASADRAERYFRLYR